MINGFFRCITPQIYDEKNRLPVRQSSSERPQFWPHGMSLIPPASGVADPRSNMRLSSLLLAPFVAAVAAAEPPPYDYKIVQKKFNAVYVLPPECAPEHLGWSQADCSNDKVSAARRFSAE